MDVFAHLGLGFSTALSLYNIGFCFVGVFLGTLVGVLPGIGPVATISMLLPITFAMQPVSALIMMAGIYYGTQYGGSTTSILINMPGEASSIVTALDGYQMARKGRAGAALATAAIGSFFAGSVSTVLIAVLAPPLTELALRVGSPEYFALMVLGLVASISLAQGSILKALGMLVLGVLFGTIGQDMDSGAERFTFGIPDLADGLEFVAIAMGLKSSVCFNAIRVGSILRMRARSSSTSAGKSWRISMARRLPSTPLSSIRRDCYGSRVRCRSA
jgi:putative tricarboxylic transport membrane protein